MHVHLLFSDPGVKTSVQVPAHRVGCAYFLPRGSRILSETGDALISYHIGV